MTDPEKPDWKKNPAIESPVKEFVDPEDITMTAEAQKHVIKELSDKIQHLVSVLDDNGLLEDGAYTFPDGDVWKARDVEPQK